MNILMTGGTGLIGTALTEKLLQNNELTILTRNSHLANQASTLKYVNTIAEIEFNKLDLIINLAGEPIVNRRWSQRQKDILCNSRWKLTESLVSEINAVASEKEIRLISASAVGYYGRQGNMPINESYDHSYPEFSQMLCQRWEQIAQSAHSAKVALLRTGIVLSPLGGALSKMLPAFKLGLGGPMASGQQYMPWIHIDDFVNAVLYIIEHETLVGPFNLTAPNPVTNREFSKTLAKSLNRPCIFSVPEFALRLLMGEMADLLVYGQNAVPQNLLDAGYRFKYDTLQPALNDIVKRL